MIQAFRDGKLGRWTLDSLGRGGEAVDVAEDVREEEETGKVRNETRWSYLSRELTIPAPSESEAAVGEAVDTAVSEYLETQATPTLADLSGHQAKKLVKADQARVRDVKRQSRAVAKVSGPGGGIKSARRRNYRR